tara:strand:+ start:567 stop:809 length:243 start_codon:yes stop_codon:yes gene_type:complete
MDYNTGWQYSVTGTNVSADGSLTPTGTGSVNNTSVTLDGVTSTWNGLNLSKDQTLHKQTTEWATSNLRKVTWAQASQITQ